MDRSTVVWTLAALVLAGCAAPAANAPATPAAGSNATPAAWPNVTVVAHRGGAALAPENTLAAFKNAIQIGVDMVECDVHLSQDGELVVMHDPDVSRTTNGSGTLGQMTLADIKKLNAAAKFGNGSWAEQTVPTLGELLDLVKGKTGIQIEIKTAPGNTRYPGIERKVVDMVKAKGMVDQTIIISFDFPTLQEVKTLEPKLRTGALVTSQWMTAHMSDSPEKIVAEATQAINADYFMPAAGSVSEPLVKATHAANRKMGVWTVDAIPDMRRLAQWGVDAITSNKPDDLKRTMGKTTP